MVVRIHGFASETELVVLKVTYSTFRERQKRSMQMLSVQSPSTYMLSFAPDTVTAATNATGGNCEP